MIFSVKVYPQAENDLREIRSYIERHSPRGAVSWLNAFEQEKFRLAENPESYSEAEENKSFNIAIKQALYYRIIFTIAGNEVRILRVRGTGQDSISEQEI